MTGGASVALLRRVPPSFAARDHAVVHRLIFAGVSKSRSLRHGGDGVVSNGFVISIVDNRGPNNAHSWLETRLRDAVEVNIAVAFVTARAVDELLPALKRIADAGRVRILTGFYQGFTEPAALRTLLRESQRRKGFHVHISERNRFHSKLFVIKTRRSRSVLIGSSNLTMEGLHGEGELSMAMSGRDSIGPIDDYFAAEWKYSRAVSVALIDDYQSRRRRRESGLTESVTAILRRHPIEPEGVEAPRRAFWIDGIHGYVDARTEKRVRSTTDWDERGLDWYAAGANGLCPGDLMILFDYSESPVVRLVEVRDMTKMATPTPDGKYFVAHGRVEKTRARALTPDRRKKLRRIGTFLPKTKLRRIRVSEARWRETLEALGYSTAPA